MQSIDAHVPVQPVQSWMQEQMCLSDRIHTRSHAYLDLDRGSTSCLPYIYTGVRASSSARNGQYLQYLVRYQRIIFTLMHRQGCTGTQVMTQRG